MDQTSGWAVWLTGLPASGKTTLARALRCKLNALGISAIVLDSDELRRVLLPNGTYTPAERDWFYNRLVELAAWLVRSGEHVIIAATGNRRWYREMARARLGPRFAEVWVRCPLDICRTRDSKGLYARAAAGLVHNLPGVDTPYEVPEQPEIVVDTDRLTPEEAAAIVLANLAFVQRAPLSASGSAPSRSPLLQTTDS